MSILRWHYFPEVPIDDVSKLFICSSSCKGGYFEYTGYYHPLYKNFRNEGNFIIKDVFCWRYLSKSVTTIGLGGWSYVKDALPNSNERVKLYGVAGNKRFSSYGYFNNGSWEFDAEFILDELLGGKYTLEDIEIFAWQYYEVVQHPNHSA